MIKANVFLRLIVWAALWMAFGIHVRALDAPDVSLHSFGASPPNLACHYSTVGFKTSLSVEDMMLESARFLQNPNTNQIPVIPKDYNCLHHLPTSSGAEYWGAVNSENLFMGIDPHIAGPSRLSVRLTKKTWNDDRSVFSFIGRARAKNDNADGSVVDEEDFELSGDTTIDTLPLELEFCCPTALLLGADLTLPTVCTAQIAAFAHELDVFESEAAYDKYCKEQEADKVQLAPHSFGSLHIFRKKKENRQRKRADPWRSLRGM